MTRNRTTLSPSPRSRGRRAAVLPAVLSALALLGLAGCGGDTSVGHGDDRAGGPARGPAGGPDWRTEYWHDLRVDVPADWSWGAGPSPQGADPDQGRLVRCGGPDDPEVAYVGRPLVLSDLCRSAAGDGPPAAAYVWLDAGLHPGTRDLGDGFVEETVEVGGGTVTVGTDDPGLRRRVLASAAGSETCLSRLDRAPRVRAQLVEGMGDVHSLQVCAYRRADTRWDLVYADTLGPGAGRRFGAAVGEAPDRNGCPAEGSTEMVVLTAAGDDPLGDRPVTQDQVVDLGCTGVEVAPGQWRRLTREAAEPWARGGIPHVLVGPAQGRTQGPPGEWAGLFVGPMG